MKKKKILSGETVASASDHSNMLEVRSSWRHDVYAYFASGVGLQELYIQPQHMSGEHWEVIAQGKKFHET